MNVKKFAAVSALAASLVFSGGASAFATTTTTTAPCPPTDTWPAAANGMPAVDPGVRLWHDANGWHVRVTHNSMHDRTFAGAIHTSGQLVDVHAVRLERNDALKVGPDKHTLVFRFNNYGHIDGFDFKTHCAPALQFGFLSDGKVLAPRFISIGRAGHHPATDPFVIKRS